MLRLLSIVGAVGLIVIAALMIYAMNRPEQKYSDCMSEHLSEPIFIAMKICEEQTGYKR